MRIGLRLLFYMMWLRITDFTLEELQTRFGDAVANIVDGGDKI